eukprot:6207218-Pleurochrysis_carterae.AAC.5
MAAERQPARWRGCPCHIWAVRWLRLPLNTYHALWPPLQPARINFPCGQRTLHFTRKSLRPNRPEMGSEPLLHQICIVRCGRNSRRLRLSQQSLLPSLAKIYVYAVAAVRRALAALAASAASAAAEAVLAAAAAVFSAAAAALAMTVAELLAGAVLVSGTVAAVAATIPISMATALQVETTCFTTTLLEWSFFDAYHACFADDAHLTSDFCVSV